MNRLLQYRGQIHQTVRGPFRLRQDGPCKGDIVRKRFLALLWKLFSRQFACFGRSCLQVKFHGSSVRIWIVSVGCWFSVVIVFTNDIGFWPLQCIVLDSVQEVSKPFVHHLERRFATVTALVIVNLCGKTFGLHSVVNTQAVFGNHIPVIESVCHQHSGFHRAQIIQVVPSGPEIIIVAFHPVLSSGHFSVLDH